MTQTKILEISENKIVFTRNICRIHGRNKDQLSITIPMLINYLLKHKDLVKVTLEKL